MINPSELIIDVFSEKSSKNGQIAYPFRCQFVKITHVPSGIVVTKENKAQLKAKQEVLEELEMLVELWEG